MANKTGAARSERGENRSELERCVASVSYPGTPASVREARLYVRGALSASPRVDDLELIAAELVTNAIRHTPSGQAGGTFAITILSAPDTARIEVIDLGSGPVPAEPRPETLCDDPLSEDGRGLLIVAALADKAGCDRIDGRRHCAWAEVSWLAPVAMVTFGPRPRAGASGGYDHWG
jgi:anti-sigma regulatory factor (Ser/Thr protein kinase)